MNLHWTSHVQNFVSVIYPIGYLCYQNLHESFIHRRYFLRPSPVRIDDFPTFAEAVEEELIHLSERRPRPLKNVKLFGVAIDSMESDTLGSFTFRYGALVKYSARLLLGDVNQFRKTYKNLNSYAGFQTPFVDVAELSDEELKSILLPESAVRFAISRHLYIADCTAHIFTPLVIATVIFNAAIVFIQPLGRLVGNVIAIGFAIALSTAVTYYMIQVTEGWRDLRIDRNIFSCQSDHVDYAKGCEEYLQRSMELGRLIRARNGADSPLGQRFDENGDCLSHIVPYSRRLAAVRDYQAKRDQVRKTMTKRMARKAERVKAQATP